MRRMSVLLVLALLLLAPVACRSTPGTEEPPTAEEEAREPTEAAESPTVAATTDVMAFDPATPGGSLTIGQSSEPDQLYLYGSSMLAAAHVQSSLYDGPIEGLDYDFEPVILEALPKLENQGSGAALDTVTVQAGDRYVDPQSQDVMTATAAVADLQQLTVRFKLKQGVTWEDGTPVTASDSVFSWNLSCDPGTPTGKFVCERTARYEAIDDLTVEWQGLPGFTDQTYFTNFATPLPRHQTNAQGTRMDEMEPGAIPYDATFTRKPMSYGPFKIETWAGDHITLVKNDNYWRKNEGLPFLDSVVHRFYPDSKKLLDAVISGDVDVATQDGLDVSQSDALDRAADEGSVVPYYVIGTVWEHIDFDLDPADGRVPLGACTDIRKAIITGTDREAMVRDVEKGKSRVQYTFVPAEHWAYPPKDAIVTYPYDAGAAKRMLDDLGFVDDNDPETPRTASRDITCTITIDIEGNTKEQLIPKGTALTLDLITTSQNAMREDTTLLFQQNMKSIGVGVDLEYQPVDTFFANGRDGALFGRRFDLGEFAWLTGVQPPVALYYCTEIPSEANEWRGQNETGWCNRDYDSAAKRAATTLTRKESLPYYYDAQKLFMDNLPVMPLFTRVKVMATSPAVVNFRPNATANTETWNIETWGFK